MGSAAMAQMGKRSVGGALSHLLKPARQGVLGAREQQLPPHLNLVA